MSKAITKIWKEQSHRDMMRPIIQRTRKLVGGWYNGETIIRYKMPIRVYRARTSGRFVSLPSMRDTNTGEFMNARS